MGDLPVFRLVDVLARLPLPDDLVDLGNVSTKWRCVIAPRVRAAAGEEEEESILMTLDRGGTPIFLPRERATAAYEGSGPDALSFVRDKRWNRFPKPQIAVRGGWGSPGTTLESSEYHQLIAAFDEVFDHKAAVEVPLTEEERRKEEEARKAEQPDDAADTVEDGEATGSGALEMQLFHRDDAESCPQLPPLGNELRWPSFLDGASSVICDVDTVISQRGARRWWRLNDGGELVMQAALPLPRVATAAPQTPQTPQQQHTHTAGATHSSSIDAALFASGADAGPRKPVRLLLFAPKGSYDWFVHDDESIVRGRIACLDLFHTPDEALPTDPSMLPVLTVAVVEAGGEPLLIPPNLLCLSVTLNDCVVVEQRRLSHTLWLDEVSYFLHRTAQWASPPLIYEFIDKDLQDQHYVSTDLIPALMELFRRHDGRNPYEEAIRRRLTVSLLAIAVNEKHYQLSESSRASLQSYLHSNEEMKAILEAARGDYCFLTPTPLSLEEDVRLYWEIKAWWPKPGCVMKPPLLSRQARTYSTVVLAAREWFLPVVYSRSRPIYGTERTALEHTVTEYFEMKDLETRRRELLAYLRTRKQKADELLDELF